VFTAEFIFQLILKYADLLAYVDVFFFYFDVKNLVFHFVKVFFPLHPVYKVKLLLSTSRKRVGRVDVSFTHS